MTCCEVLRNGRSSAPSLPLVDQSDLLDQFVFGDQGNVNLTTGAHTLVSDGGVSLAFAATQQGTIFDLQSGAAGLRFDADATNTLFTSVVATRTAAALMFRLSDFYAAFSTPGRPIDSSRSLLIAIYCRVLTIPAAQASPGGFQFGILGRATLPSGGADRLIATKRNNAAGAQALGSLRDAAAGSNYTTPAPVANTKAFAILLHAGGARMLAGDWNTAGGQSWEDVRFDREVSSQITTTVAGNQFADLSNDVYMAFPTGQVTGDMLVNVERMVFRSPR